MTTRHDPRYVDRADPRAHLHAWGGDDLTMDMGGWTDDDRIAFLAAAQDAALATAGQPLTQVVIHTVERDADGDDLCCHGR